MSEIVFESLTKAYIFNRLTQEEIFEKYLGIKVDLSLQYCNPMRKDNNPGCTFYYKNGTLRFNDWAGYFHGDCFDLVGFMTNTNAKTAKGFMKVLDTIAKEFRIHIYEDKEYVRELIYKKVIEVKKSKPNIEKKVIINAKKRDFNGKDAEFWSQYYLGRTILEFYNVYPCSLVYVNNQIVYKYDNDYDLAYCYDFGNGYKKIYFPNRETNRFLCNTSIIQGNSQSIPSKFGIITKSMKDVMCLKKVCKGYFDIDSVAPQNEKYLLKKDEVRNLNNSYDYLFTLYDFDAAGIRTANKFKRIYGISPMFFTNGRFGSTDYKSKDFSDFLMNNGIDKTRKLVERVYNYYEQQIEQYEQESSY